MTVERTFVMLKPDCVQRGLIGEVISRFEKVGLKMIGMKFVHIDADFSKKHYNDHVDKPFYPGLEDMITSGPVVAMVWEGAKAISLVRKMVGATEPSESLPGTIRGDYAHITYARADATGGQMPNIVHASDSPEGAEKEIALWFSENEMWDKYNTVFSKFM